MFKTLMKKEFVEFFSSIFQNKKNGKKRSAAVVVLYALLFIYLFGMFGSLFYMLSDAICNVYFDMNLGWLYFTLFGIIATALGIFMSIFSVYSSVYKSKDTEMLLSMPIPPSFILSSKLIATYIITMFFEALVLVPGYAVFFMNREFTAINIIFAVVNILTLPLFSVAIGCILGWLIALIASRVKKGVKTAATLLVSVAFLVVYFYFVSGATNVIGIFVDNPDKVAGFAKVFYPIYAFGKGAAGDMTSFFIYLGVVLLIFGVVYLLLSKTYISIATKNKGSSVKAFKKTKLSSGSLNKALLKKEFMRFKSSPAYMLNSCMGTLIAVIAIVMIFINYEKLSNIPQEIHNYIGIIACGIMAYVGVMNDITAPSVSFEGKSIWIVQSIPAPAWSVLKSKLWLHMIITVIPNLALAAVIEVLFKMDIVSMVMLIVYAVLFPLFEGVFGLMLNIKMPNLNWKNENYAVKQGANILAAVFGGMGIVVVLTLGYILLMDYISTALYICTAAAVVFIATVLMIMWIKKKGTKIFSTLS